MKKICAIVVTFNRKELLLRCLKALAGQSAPLSAILIVDNASTDNTFEYLTENSFIVNHVSQADHIRSSYNNIEIYYYRLPKNTGGAGGFHTGLDNAVKLKEFDLYWMMDDDGYPSASCLEKLMPYVDKYDYVMPVSVDIDDFEKLSWPVRKKDNHKTTLYSELKSSWGEIMNYIFPFNGSLLSGKILAEVGYPKKELFLWGDEYEHYWRCRKAGYNPVTIVDAAFYHPANKMSFEPILGGAIKVPYTENEWRFICLIRNSTYIDWNYTGKHRILMKFLIYSYLLLIKKRLNMKRYSLYLKSVGDGVRGDFSRHLKYLN